MIEHTFMCERVWKAWTDPEQLNQWWGPKGFTPRQTKVDRPGGGAGKLNYREIVAPKRLVGVV